MNKEDIEAKLREAFHDADIRLRDMTGGGDHWQLDIASSQFVGKSLVQQHQLVYAALGEWMKQEIHALALNTSEKV